MSREDTVLIEASVPAGDKLWENSGIEWDGPVDVTLQASFAGSGEIVVRGKVRGALRQECRRCLRPVRGEFDEDLTLVFVEGEGDADSGDGDEFVYDPTRGELDLSDAVREEVILAMNPYVVCDPECKGLCPRCGANLNEVTCECAAEEGDPRWEALRALKDR